MKFALLFFCTLLAICVVASAQTEFASSSYFPAELEFRELQKVISEQSFDDPGRLNQVRGGNLILDVGFDKYASRTYAVEGSKELAIEIITLKDSRAAYSLLTLLRSTSTRAGPPGDAYATEPGSLQFSQNRIWVRVEGPGVSDEILRRVAVSVSNRIGIPELTTPSLLSHLPKQGYDASGLLYFPGLEAFKTFSGSDAIESLKLVSDAEIAQARYTINNHPVVMLLLNFPTGQIAEDYFEAVGSTAIAGQENISFYVKRVGPLVAILKGPIDPSSADGFLSTLHYSYSIRWIFEKKNQSKVIWGVPVTILGTVVKSLFFIAILGVLSIFAGAGFALLRFAVRSRVSKNVPDRSEDADIIRLRLR